MLAFTAMSLITTTYAFVILNKSVEVDPFDINVESGGGLLISLDGKTFKSGITIDELKEQIKKNTGKEYNELICAPVSISQTNGLIDYDDEGHLKMEKDHITDNPANPNSLYKLHEMVEAEKSDYLTVDFYFKVVGNVDFSKNYKLTLSGSSKLDGGKVKTVTPKNNLSSYDKATNDVVVYGPTQENKTLDVNPYDALRMAIYHNIENENSDTKMDNNNLGTNEIYIIENSLGLGSSAIENRSNETDVDNYDIKHDKNKNAMYTYYNSLFPFENFTSAAEDGEAFDTIKLEEMDLARFVKISDNEYQTLRISVTIWLEGWDADYFLESDNGLSEFGIFLKFDLNEV